MRLLLRDARFLCEAGSFASAVVLTAFAREELGRYKILRGLWKRVMAGETLTVEQIAKRCKQHDEKQREAMFIVVQRADSSTKVGQLIQARMEAVPGSPEWKKADEELDKISQLHSKRTPGARDKSRMRALYVEPLEDGWNRPSETSETAAREFLADAINDYSFAQRFYLHPDLYDDLDFHAALERWQDRPELLPATSLHKFG